MVTIREINNKERKMFQCKNKKKKTLQVGLIVGLLNLIERQVNSQYKKNHVNKWSPFVSKKKWKIITKIYGNKKEVDEINDEMTREHDFPETKAS